MCEILIRGFRVVAQILALLPSLAHFIQFTVNALAIHPHPIQMQRLCNRCPVNLVRAKADFCWSALQVALCLEAIGPELSHLRRVQLREDKRDRLGPGLQSREAQISLLISHFASHKVWNAARIRMFVLHETNF